MVDYKYTKEIKKFIHSVVNQHFEELKSVSFEDFIKRFTPQFDEIYPEEKDPLLSYYWSKLTEPQTDKYIQQFIDELKIFYTNQYGFDNVHVELAYQDDSGQLSHFGINPQIASIYGVSDISKIKTVHFIIDFVQTEPDWESDDYWGWWDYLTGKFTMIFQNYKVFHVCFPYGVEEAEQSLQGKAYKLRILNIYNNYN